MKRKKKNKRIKKYILYFSCSLVLAITAGGLFLIFLLLHNSTDPKIDKLLTGQKNENQLSPDVFLMQYMSFIESKDYEKMYSMLDEQSKTNISQENFIDRNKKIYEGIEAKNVTAKVTGSKKSENNETIITYHMSLDSIAGKIQFENQVVFTKEKTSGYTLSWDDSFIFPALTSNDKVRVSLHPAKRGDILDRNNKVLAGPGTASLVGLVPGKMNQEPGKDIGKIASLLGITKKSINKSLSAKWVKENSLVPIKTIKKLDEAELLTNNPGKETLENKALQEKLLDIPGVMITDTQVRTYPLSNAAAHLTGYVQKVTAEDLEKHKGEGYNSNSLIGRSGMESLYEKELKGQDGYEIDILDSEGQVKEILADQPKKDGLDITLTIDSNIQKNLYEKFKEDKSCSAALNPLTGEVLALVSTPAFDSNDFIMGMSEKQWNQLNKNKKKPLYNRFRQTWCPGSTFKPLIGAIGLSTGAIDANEDYGSVGRSWQKDKSWGGYCVTTLHTYKPVILENALIHSDNIYFAKAALRIGADNLEKGLDQLGFNQKLPFEITMSQSGYSNSQHIETEIQLADSGYGQGQILINPLHLAVLYSAFLNEGNVIKPYLLYKEDPKPEIWLKQVFSPEVAEQIRDAMEKVVNSPEGTGYAAHRKDVKLAGKTGTAEIKTSKEDTSGTELGWFGIFTEDSGAKNPILLMSMVEDVKNHGGSSYVVKKDTAVLEEYFSDQE
ncbi:penicillin-binding transpeptidase domain-containing protein [Anaerocolumna sp. MB42-C2]|uniref:penicillin-binding transpeptidase domain-containing protein n=1 Tax=Anaerocolumna sp. MB42-C2 TaxID=3070997 RepID=UPI0027E137C6|nr:penicillin-binding transpeptidase domain-containing protein [Anaerocolumna sp. MB42-C2]WMJ86421.1 penicillin-binding transpeptidase domain-containing protein [Anaerocolumna sp. MB42-C2]